MASITTSLSTRVDARGKSEILLRFVGGRDHIYRLHSRLFVAPARWKAGAVVIPRLGTDEQRELQKLRDQLDDLQHHLLDSFQTADLSRVNREWMQGAVDKFFHPDSGQEEDLLALFDEFSRTRDVGEGRRKRYDVVRGSLARYKEIRSGGRITTESFTTETLEDYHDFLSEEYRLAGQKKWRSVYKGMWRDPKERGRNVIIDYIKILRSFFRWLDQRGIRTREPFKGFQIGTAVYGTPYYLTIEERERVYRTNLSRHPALEVQRDIFVFQCLVGCRVGDLVNLRKEDVVDGVLTYIPRKTLHERAAAIRVPLTQTAQEIVARYRDYPGPRLLPFITQQRYNDALKRIFLAARMRRTVPVLDPITRKEVKLPLYEVASSHIARRTFIGNLYKQVADPNLIGSMSGHREGSVAFARYRDIDDEMKANLVDKLDAK